MKRLLALLIALLFAVACGGSGNETGSSSSPATSPSETVPITSPTGISPVPAAGAPLETNGRYHVLITRVEEGPPAQAEIDIVELLSGEAAVEAAVEDGDIPPGDTLPNDFYIRNRSTTSRILEMVANPRITLLQCPQECRSVPVTLAQLEEFERSNGSVEGFLGSLLYLIQLEGGRLAQIEAVYTP